MKIIDTFFVYWQCLYVSEPSSWWLNIRIHEAKGKGLKCVKSNLYVDMENNRHRGTDVDIDTDLFKILIRRHFIQEALSLYSNIKQLLYALVVCHIDFDKILIKRKLELPTRLVGRIPQWCVMTILKFSINWDRN